MRLHIYYFIILWITANTTLTAQLSTKALLKKAAQHIQIDADSTLWYAQQAQKKAQIEKDSLLWGQALLLEGIAYQSTHAYQLSITTGYKAKQIFEDIKNTKLVTFAENNIALVYQEIGLYEKAAALYLNSLRYFEAVKDTLHLIGTYNNLGIVYQNIKNYDLALNYYTQGLAYYHQDSIYESFFDNITAGKLHLNKGLVHWLKQENTKAWQHYTQALSKFKTINALDDIRKVYQNMAILYREQEELDSALLYLDNAYNAGEKFAEQDHIYYTGVGGLYSDKKEYAKALYYYEKAYQLKPTYGNREEFLTVLEGLSEIHTKMGAYKEALKYKTEAKVLQDSVYQRDRIKQVQALEIQYSVEKKEQEIAMLNDSLALEQNKRELAEQKAVVQQLYRNLAIGGIILSLLLIWLLINRIRIRNQLFAARETSLKNQNKILELERQQLQLDLEHKNRTLSNMALAAVQKNEMLDSLSEQLNTLTQKNQQASLAVKPIQKMIQEQVSIESEWEEFRVHFEEVHPNFYKKLLQITPSLTQNDLKHCTYIKVKLDSKQIARIMGISPKSVQMNRYRIKKKLQLEKDEDLFVFIEQL